MFFIRLCSAEDLHDFHAIVTSCFYFFSPACTLIDVCVLMLRSLIIFFCLLLRGALWLRSLWERLHKIGDRFPDFYVFSLLSWVLEWKLIVMGEKLNSLLHFLKIVCDLREFHFLEFLRNTSNLFNKYLSSDVIVFVAFGFSKPFSTSLRPQSVII